MCRIALHCYNTCSCGPFSGFFELALKAVALVHTPLANVEEAPLQQRLQDVAKKVRIMQALLDARNRRA